MGGHEGCASVVQVGDGPLDLGPLIEAVRLGGGHLGPGALELSALVQDLGLGGLELGARLHHLGVEDVGIDLGQQLAPLDDRVEVDVNLSDLTGYLGAYGDGHDGRRGSAGGDADGEGTPLDL